VLILRRPGRDPVDLPAFRVFEPVARPEDGAVRERKVDLLTAGDRDILPHRPVQRQEVAGESVN